MQSIDISQASKSIQRQIGAIKDFNAVSAAGKQAQKTEGNSLTQSAEDLSQQLNKIREDVKRFQRDNLSSMDNLLNYLGLTSGNGSETMRFFRKKIIQAAVKIEPEIQNILAKEVVKALGCSQEQTFDGFALSFEDLAGINGIGLSQRPVSDGIYIPIQSLDFFGNLKQDLTSAFGKFFYEKRDPSTDPSFVPYGGPDKFPMNKLLKLLMTNNYAGRSYLDIYGKSYQGESTQPLFDILYTDQDGFGNSGHFFRIMLIDREQQNGTKLNTITSFVKDYYSTLKLVDPVLIGAQIVNLFSGAVSMQFNRTDEQISNQTAFGLIIQRILGLCFDSRQQEIDVSGVSKIAELDGVDESFFELTDVDLRKIDLAISNIQQGVTQFEDCGNIKLPVDSKVVVDELVKFRDNLDGNSDAANSRAVENLIDTVLNNPEWQSKILNGVALDVSVSKNVVKQIPIAVAAAVLTPKVLLPIFALLAVVENQANLQANKLVKFGNQQADQGINKDINDLNEQIGEFNRTANAVVGASNEVQLAVTDGLDFLKKFRAFNTEVISQIGAVFLKTLFNLLKKDIVKLTTAVIGDVKKSSRIKNQQLILRLVKIAAIVAQALITLADARKCKNLLNDIQTLLELIFSGGNMKIPEPLLFLAEFLPGTSPERSTINIFKALQSFGIETGPLPGGFPNLMGLYTYAVTKGIDEEETANGKVQGIGFVPPLTGGLIKMSGKKL